MPPSGKMLRKEAGVIRVLNMLRESDGQAASPFFAAKRPTLAAEFTREICGADAGSRTETVFNNRMLLMRNLFILERPDILIRPL